MGHGESSLQYGLRCDELDKSVDEDDTCNRFVPHVRFEIKDKDKKITELENLLREACGLMKQDYIGMEGDIFLNKPEIENLVRRDNAAT